MVVLVRDSALGWVLLTGEQIRASGCAVGLVTGPLTAAEEAAIDGIVDRVAVVGGPPDAGRIAEAALELSRGHRLAAVLSLADSTVVAAAEAAAKVGVGRCSAQALARSRNKYAARCALRDAGLPVPRFALMSDPEEADLSAWCTSCSPG